MRAGECGCVGARRGVGANSKPSKIDNIKRWPSGSGVRAVTRPIGIIESVYGTYSSRVFGAQILYWLFPLFMKRCATIEMTFFVRVRAGECECVGAGASWRRCRCEHVLAGESCLSLPVLHARFVVPSESPLRTWKRSSWLFSVDPRQHSMSTTEELLARLVNLENEAVQARQRQGSAEQALSSSPAISSMMPSSTELCVEAWHTKV